MTRKLSARTLKTRRLGQQDAQHRCSHCKGPFRGLVVEDFIFPGRFCSDACLRDAQAVAAMKEGQ